MPTSFKVVIQNIPREKEKALIDALSEMVKKNICTLTDIHMSREYR